MVWEFGRGVRVLLFTIVLKFQNEKGASKIKINEGRWGEQGYYLITGVSASVSFATYELSTIFFRATLFVLPPAMYHLVLGVRGPVVN